MLSKPELIYANGAIVARLNYVWRLFATGFSFILFAIGGAGIATAMALVLLLVPTKLVCRKVVMRLCISYAFCLYICLLKGLRLLTYEVQGIEHLRASGQLIIANHPSLLDVVFLISLIRNADCIVKSALWVNPLTAFPVKAAQFVRNVPEQLLERAVASLLGGNSLIVFPEGTRSKPSEPLKFLRGAANIALSADKAIVPVVITCEPATLLKDQRWYEIPPVPPHYVLRVLPELDVGQVVDRGQPQCKSARQLTRYLEQLFCNELLRSG